MLFGSYFKTIILFFYSALIDEYVDKNQISCALLHSTIKICSVYITIGFGGLQGFPSSIY